MCIISLHVSLHSYHQNVFFEVELSVFNYVDLCYWPTTYQIDVNICMKKKIGRVISRYEYIETYSNIIVLLVLFVTRFKYKLTALKARYL